MKKGFTLIELLAVIIILGIIALIAIPTVTKVIEQAKKKSFISTSSSIEKVLEDECNVNLVKGNNSNIAYSFNDNDNKIGLKGKLPKNGGAMITDGECNASINVNDGKTCAVKSSKSEKMITGKIVDGMCIADEIGSSSCTNSDSNPGAFRGTGIETDPYLIESIEDLYSLKQQTSTDTNNKHYRLNVDLDFKDDCSYKDATTTAYGDINGDGKTSGLKEELTTGRGFTYQGEEPQIFSGNFNGNNKIIRNMYMNGNETNSYAGLFEKVQNTTNPIYFKNLILENVNINNVSEKVGGLIGNILEQTKVNIDNIQVTGNIIANSRAAGIIGESSSIGGSVFNNLSFLGNVNCGSKYCGGILGIQKNTVAANEIPITMSNIRSNAYLVAYESSGIVSGILRRANLNNIYSYGKIANTNSYSYIGGIAGELYVENNYLLKNLYNYADIEFNGENSGGIVGGVFGIIDPSFEFKFSGEEYHPTIKNAYNYGNIKLLKTNGDIGGIVGSGSIKKYYNCYNYGDVTAPMIENDYQNGGQDISGVGYGKECINCANYGNITGNENVYGIGKFTYLSNSVNTGNITAIKQAGVFSVYSSSQGVVPLGKNVYSLGEINVDNNSLILQGNLENAYAREDVYADGPKNQSYAFEISGITGANKTNVAFIGSITKNDANDRSLTDPNWTNRISFANVTLPVTNVYSCQTGGNVSATNVTSVPFSSITTSWFRDVLQLGNSFEYQEGYYPRVYKLDENGNVTRELVEGQSLVPIR